MAQRKSIKLYPPERKVLVELYLRRRIPIDQYESRPDDQCSFVDEWAKLTTRRDTFEELLHYMRSQRKRGLWVRFDGNHEPAKPPVELTAEETEILVAVYAANVTAQSAGSDNLGYDLNLLSQLAQEFAARTGRFIHAHDLNAKLTALRKRGLLTKVADLPQATEDMGFEDMDQAAG